MPKCMSCGKEIESGNICKDCFENKDDDYSDYLPEYGDTYGKHNGTLLVNAKSLLGDSDEMSACSYLKGSYMQIDVGDIRLDFLTAVKDALALVEKENLECAYVYSSDFKAFKVSKSYWIIEKCYLLTDYADTLKKLVFSIWDTFISPDDFLKEDFEVSKLPPEKFYKYEDYIFWKKHH